MRLIGHHTGILLGFYGTSRHAKGDIGTMRPIADIPIMSPADGAQLKAAIAVSVDHDRPITFGLAAGVIPFFIRTAGHLPSARPSTPVQGRNSPSSTG